MTTQTKSGTTTSSAEPTQPAENYDAPLLRTPLVLEPVKKKKKKKYTRGTKALQDFAQGISDAAYRSANSIGEATNTFSKRSKKSARKRRDGLVWDSLQNAGRAFGDGATELGKAPDALTRRIRTGQIRRAVRTFVR